MRGAPIPDKNTIVPFVLLFSPKLSKCSYICCPDNNSSNNASPKKFSRNRSRLLGLKHTFKSVNAKNGPKKPNAIKLIHTESSPKLGLHYGKIFGNELIFGSNKHNEPATNTKRNNIKNKIGQNKCEHL